VEEVAAATAGAVIIIWLHSCGRSDELELEPFLLVWVRRTFVTTLPAVELTLAGCLLVMCLHFSYPDSIRTRARRFLRCIPSQVCFELVLVLVRSSKHTCFFLWLSSRAPARSGSITTWHDGVPANRVRTTASLRAISHQAYVRVDVLRHWHAPTGTSGSSESGCQWLLLQQ
jgi:hypothetical protein